MNLESLITKLKPVMRRAGEEIMDIYRVGAKPNFKEDGSPVTLADKRSEEIILKALKRLLKFSTYFFWINNSYLNIYSLFRRKSYNDWF